MFRTLPTHGTSKAALRSEAKRSRARKTKFISGVGALGFVCALCTPQFQRYGRRLRRKGDALRLKRKFLNPMLVDGFVGAVGEIGQLAILYPLDTIKVRCQAQGASTGAVWAAVRRQGMNKANLASLFAGCGPSAVCAAVIGACYLASFSAAKRVLARATVVTNRKLVLPLIGSRHSCAEASTSDQGTPASSASTSGRIESSDSAASQEAQGTAVNDSAAALVASLLTSVLEAPVELFRHRMQAGLSSGRMLSNMASAFGGKGLGELYWGYTPFLLKALPYDVAELISYSQLTRHQDGLPLLSALPMAFRDCFIGAMAGAAAVVVSMPVDCVKTRLELGSSRPPSGLFRGTAACLRTGSTILAEKGVGGLYVGITPRLMENVPSTMFYWVLVAALRRALKPYTNDGEELEAEACAA